jgi:hypothetical protein
MLESKDTVELLEEIGRYLAVIELFRAEGCEPDWRPELAVVEPVTPTLQPRRLSFDVGLH